MKFILLEEGKLSNKIEDNRYGVYSIIEKNYKISIKRTGLFRFTASLNGVNVVKGYVKGQEKSYVFLYNFKGKNGYIKEDISFIELKALQEKIKYPLGNAFIENIYKTHLEENNKIITEKAMAKNGDLKAGKYRPHAFKDFCAYIPYECSGYIFHCPKNITLYDKKEVTICPDTFNEDNYAAQTKALPDHILDILNTPYNYNLPLSFINLTYWNSNFKTHVINNMSCRTVCLSFAGSNKNRVTITINNLSKCYKFNVLYHGFIKNIIINTLDVNDVDNITFEAHENTTITINHVIGDKNKILKSDAPYDLILPKTPLK